MNQNDLNTLYLQNQNNNIHTPLSQNLTNSLQTNPTSLQNISNCSSCTSTNNVNTGFSLSENPCKSEEFIPKIPLHNPNKDKTIYTVSCSDGLQFENDYLTPGLTVIPALIPLFAGFAIKSIASFAASKTLNWLFNIFFPENKEDQMDAILEEVEIMLNKRLTDEKKNELDLEYEGFIVVLDSLCKAINALPPTNYPTNLTETEINNIYETVRTRYHATDLLFRQEIPSFSIEGYEEITLPLYVSMCTMHLTIQKIAIVSGKTWGFDDLTINIMKEDFLEDLQKYTSVALNMYNTGFNNIINNEERSNTEVIKYKTITIFSRDQVYYWSLLRYDGLQCRLARSFWHWSGHQDKKLKLSQWKGQYTFMNGSLNSNLKDVTFDIIEYNYLISILFLFLRVHPQYNSKNNLHVLPITGWVGDSRHWQGQRQFKGSAQNVSSVQVYKMEAIEFNDHRIYGIKKPDNTITYGDTFLRSITTDISVADPVTNLNLSKTIELRYSQPSVPYLSALIFGFTPNSEKDFFTNGYHTLKKDEAYAIPPTQFLNITTPASAEFKEQQLQGTDGTVVLFGKGSTNTITYRIQLDLTLNPTTEYKILFRVAGGSGWSSPILTPVTNSTTTCNNMNNNMNNDIILNMDLIGNATEYQYDYISDSFTWNQIPGKYIDLKITCLQDSFLEFSQIHIVPASQFQMQI